MPIRAKSVYDPPSPDDGLRVLTTTYWPRGVAKSKVDVYNRVLAPTRELLHAFKSGELRWEDYEPRYLAFVGGKEQQEEIALLAELARTEPVTVMCMCKDDTQCHRRLLQELIETRLDSL